MRPVGALLLALAVSGASLSAAGPRDAIAKARVLYNQGEFEAAVQAAEEARRTPEYANSADLIIARAYLERFRLSSVPEDLARARERLRGLDPAAFTPGERLEFIVGLGETLYLDASSGAAAVLFESALATRGELPVEARERVLDWWATALDRDAQARPEMDRQPVYQKVRDRMALELAVNLGSGTASYWAAAAARGQGDLQAAWDAAQAGWARASLAADGGRALRQDLERLVTVAIIPERSRLLARPQEALKAEWERFKEKWAN